MSEITLVPCVRVTRVLPTFFTWKTEGALISYQSFLAKGSDLNKKPRNPKSERTEYKTPKRECKTGEKGSYARLLLAALFALRDTLIFANGHG